MSMLPCLCLSLRPAPIGAVALLLAACSPKAGAPLAPPAGAFTVSDYFAASGAMADGDGKSAPGMITTNQYDGGTCGDKKRSAGARGHCFTFDYVPGPNLFGGVYFQYPANNWGSEPGLSVHADKLRKVSFKYAVADDNQTMLRFGIGGIGYPTHTDADLAQGLTHSDQFVGGDVAPSATSDWTAMSLLIPPAQIPDITNIIGAFAWYASYPMGSDFSTLPPTTLYLDDLVYE